MMLAFDAEKGCLVKYFGSYIEILNTFLGLEAKIKCSVLISLTSNNL